MEFKPFKQAIAAQWARMQATGKVFLTGTPNGDENVKARERDQLWELYLESFPAGTNPIYKTRTDADCACCRAFIRTIGLAVSIVDGKLVSVWDIGPDCEGVEPGYYAVAAAMSKHVKAMLPVDIFLHWQKGVGTDTSKSLTGDGPVTVWEHFHVNLDPKFRLDEDKIPTRQSQVRQAQAVLYRTMEEISLDVFETVDELLAVDNLYRGEEFKDTFLKLYEVAKSYDKVETDRAGVYFTWIKVLELGERVTKMRSSAFGTLLIDLSTGMDLEAAVKRYEVVMAPTNYQRPQPLVTKKQLKAATEKVEELGFTGSLARRFAKLDDVNVGNLLFVDRTSRVKLGGNPLDDLEATATSKPKNLDRVEEMPIGDFLSNVLPRAHHIEVMLENRHASNMAALITAQDPTAPSLFKWGNTFSWDYQGGVADAIKERVKSRGGSVEGDLCCRLAWEYTDDLDLHMIEPGGFHIYYRNRNSPMGGHLDIDANGMDGLIEHPVENIYYPDKAAMREGIYRLSVNNFNRRSIGVGFIAEIEFGGTKFTFEYPKMVRDNETVEIAQIRYSKAKGFEIIESLPHSETVKDVWGLKTQSWHKVNAIMVSPNHWDGGAEGNKHWFFMLNGARHPGSARGFYNEFLTPKLREHRRAFELAGAKLKIEDTKDQLSGLGFSSTLPASVVVRVTGSVTRMLRVVF